jgi:hypothetical protein
MSWRLTLSVVLLATLPSPRLEAQALGADTHPMRLRVTGKSVALRTGSLCLARAGRDFRYTGGQRFVLKSVADAEQHFFVRTDGKDTIRQLYWIQAEELLPGQPGGYDYPSDSLPTVGALPWWVNLRAMNGPVQTGSDRAATVRFLTAHGFRFPDLAPRLRLVFVPEPRRRRELMVVYLEAAARAGRDTSLDAVLARAMQGLELRACH